MGIPLPVVLENVPDMSVDELTEEHGDGHKGSVGARSRSPGYCYLGARWLTLDVSDDRTPRTPALYPIDHHTFTERRARGCF